MSKPPEKSNAPTKVQDGVIQDPVADEIAKRIGSIVPTAHRAQVVAQMTSLVVQERFSGPIPHPRHFAQYEQTLPGSGRELMDMAKADLAHSQEMQRRALEADVEDMKEGRRLGFAALSMLMVGAIVCALAGKDVVALAMLGATVIGTIGQLIKGRGNGNQ